MIIKEMTPVRESKFTRKSPTRILKRTNMRKKSRMNAFLTEMRGRRRALTPLPGFSGIFYAPFEKYWNFSRLPVRHGIFRDYPRQHSYPWEILGRNIVNILYLLLKGNS
jgi:hypothetical protein